MVGEADSVIRFHPWQERFFRDTARVVLANWHRQAGKDFVAAGKAVDDAFRTGRDWYIVSVTQRQADATFAKCRIFAKAFRQVVKRQGEVRLSDREYIEYDRQIDHAFRCTARTLHLPGGGSVTALPGRDPDTLAGLTGCIIFTEFGLFPNGGYDHWRVVFPLSTRGYQVLVISTPRGKNTKFYELCRDREVYSVHFQPITKSVAEGFVLHDNQGRPTTLEEFKRIYGDESGWRREYLCEFTGDLEALVKWALLEQASDLGGIVYDFKWIRVEGDAGWEGDFFRALVDTTGRIEIGWDVARTGHLSALWVNETFRPAPRELRRLVIMHKTSFALQREIVTAAMGCSPRSVGCGDATGLGMDSNETLHTRYGDRWEPVTFTASSRRDLASVLATSYDDGEQILPPMSGPAAAKFIHTDIYSLQCDRTGSQLKIVESPNPLLPESHADLAWANALARRAGQIAFAEPYVSVVG
ncbi:MAG: hypothetical protein ACYTF6_13570 [Planctomycetota bacterium]|jgi:phage FluMu gp28-like protein